MQMRRGRAAAGTLQHCIYSGTTPYLSRRIGDCLEKDLPIKKKL
jgi:hypothetical protein